MRLLKKKAWTVFSLWIRNRDKHCVTCGSTQNLQAGHFIHRDCLDFDERNIHAQCSRCNKFLSGNLIQYAMFMEEKYGRGIIQELDQLSKQIRKFRREELEEIISKYSKS